MSISQIARPPSKILNIKHEVIKQQVRTWRKIYGNVGSLTIKHDVKPVVEPPPGVNMSVCNRNPRNLERLAIAYKNEGWHLEKFGRTYYHKLVIVETRHGVKVSCLHQNGKIAMSASTEEWSIRKFLHKSSDKSACMNLGRIFARRCLQSGLEEMINTYKFTSGGKLDLLIQEIENGGIALTEPIRLHELNPMTKVKTLKPWDVIIE